MMMVIGTCAHEYQKKKGRLFIEKKKHKLKLRMGWVMIFIIVFLINVKLAIRTRGTMG